MNSEVISSRYAKALLAYAEGSGTGNKVYSQALSLVQMLQELPQLRKYVLRHDDVALSKKLELLSLSIGEPLVEELDKFIALVNSHRRMEMFHTMLLSYISKYRQKHNIKVGSLQTAVPDEHLRERLESIFSDRTDSEVQLQMEVEPDLIGGFIFELDGYRIDASVRSRIDKIRRCLVDDSSRIV